VDVAPEDAAAKQDVNVSGDSAPGEGSGEDDAEKQDIMETDQAGEDAPMEVDDPPEQKDAVKDSTEGASNKAAVEDASSEQEKEGAAVEDDSTADTKGRNEEPAPSPAKEEEEKSSPAKAETSNKSSSEKHESKSSPAKKEETKTEEKSENEESDEEESEDEEREVPLLERSPEVTGRRQRKAVERFSEQTPEAGASRRSSAPQGEGRGTALGQCPVIEHNITSQAPDEVHVLHQIIFGRQGRPREFRKNLRNFNGFPFERDSAAYEKKKASITRYRLSVLRPLSRLLDVKVTGLPREEIGLAILHFLCDPQPSGREVPEKRRKSKSKTKTERKPRATSSEAATEEDSGEEEEGESEEEGEESEEEEEKPVSKKRTPAKRTPARQTPVKKTPAKKTPAKKTPAKKTPAKKTPAKKTPGKKTPAKAVGKKTTQPRKRKREDSEEEGNSEDSEEGPAKKQKGTKQPTDAEIKAAVEGLLEGANLEQVTMKKMVAQVNAKFPDYDLSARREFIKTTVKALIL